MPQSLIDIIMSSNFPRYQEYKKQRELGEAQQDILTLLRTVGGEKATIAEPKDPSKGWGLEATADIAGLGPGMDTSNIAQVPVKESRFYQDKWRNLLAAKDGLAGALSPREPADLKFIKGNRAIYGVDPGTGQTVSSQALKAPYQKTSASQAMTAEKAMKRIAEIQKTIDTWEAKNYEEIPASSLKTLKDEMEYLKKTYLPKGYGGGADSDPLGWMQ